jgi:hypothetical protein
MDEVWGGIITTNGTIWRFAPEEPILVDRERVCGINTLDQELWPPEDSGRPPARVVMFQKERVVVLGDDEEWTGGGERLPRLLRLTVPRESIDHVWLELEMVEGEE